MPSYRHVRIRVASDLILQSSICTWLRLFGHEWIRTAQDHLRWQVPVLFPTEWACNHDRMEWKLFHSCRNIQPTALALDNELLSTLNPTSQAADTISEYVS